MIQHHWEPGLNIIIIFDKYKAEYDALAVMESAIESRWLK